MPKYIIRLDDACSTFNIMKWQRYFDLFDKYGVKPIIAVIPNNKSEEFSGGELLQNYWDLVNEWYNKGWCIAMHGLDHVYETNKSGMLGTMPNNSEFAGLSYENQLSKIKTSNNIFARNGIVPRVFIAPSHTLDLNTLKALKFATKIDTISDGFALKPYIKYDFKWIPMQAWSLKDRLFGTWTICLHPESASEHEVVQLEEFIKRNKANISSVEDLNYKRMGFLDYAFRYLLYAKRMYIKFRMGHY